MKGIVLGLLLVLATLGQPDACTAFEHRRFRVHGYVQWISGTKLVLMADNVGSIAIDLTEVDQSSYQALALGEGVTVAGVLKPPENLTDQYIPYLALWIQRDRQ